MNQELLDYQVLIVEDDLSIQELHSAIDLLANALEEKDLIVHRAMSPAEGSMIVGTNMDLDAVLITTDMDLDSEKEQSVMHVLSRLRERQKNVPVFLLADRAKAAEAMTRELMEQANEFVWICEDSPDFIAGRVLAAIERYRANLLPPLMDAIWEYNEHNHEYSWAAPGHQGGVGFTKHPIGKKFHDFYGENLFRTDTGIERISIGSLLDHSGAFGESERIAARTFGAHDSYNVIVGTSGSNRTVMQACLTGKDIAVCDRNCHKSIEQGLFLTGAKPVYMIPTRNRYGIIGPIPRKEMTPASIAEKCKLHPGAKPAYSVVTNCTYDGLCYNASTVQKELEQSVDRIHFDEAWYGYARFNPMYHDHFAMRGEPGPQGQGPTIFATHSTHKLLTALSQASYIHIRQGRNPIGFTRFNQSYMLHSTTSPLYAICASNDVAVAMMRDSGESLTQEVIEEAVDFRLEMAKLYREYTRDGSWFFKPWNADRVTDPATGKVYDFADAPRELLTHEQSCWNMRPGEVWHGFDLSADEDNYVMLDPIKVSILCPGMGDNGSMLNQGVPAALVSEYIYREGIVPTRTTDFQLMFLFSMGITKGKWGTLINALLNFKSAYDRNAPVEDILPELVQEYPEEYEDLGIRDLGNKIFAYLRQENPTAKLNEAFSSLPAQAMTPREALEHVVTGDVEMVPSDKLANRVTANALIPYPPGIPLLISGENFGSEKSPQIGYLKTLEAWDRQFPGFEHVTEGAEVHEGKYYVMCIKQK